MRCPACGSKEFSIRVLKEGIGQSEEEKLIVDEHSVHETVMEIACQNCGQLIWLNNGKSEFPFPEGWSEEPLPERREL